MPVCLEQGPKIEGVVLDRVDILGLFCPKQALGQVPPPPGNKYNFQYTFEAGTA